MIRSSAPPRAYRTPKSSHIPVFTPYADTYSEEDDIDWVKVERCVNGECPVKELTKVERRAALQVLTEHGVPETRMAELLGTHARQIGRWQRERREFERREQALSRED